jgi:uncharacterized membrane protein
MAEHPDSLWQPFPDEVMHQRASWRGHALSAAGCRSGRAIEILEERFARGEIDTRELEARRTALRGASG